MHAIEYAGNFISGQQYYAASRPAFLCIGRKYGQTPRNVILYI